jgi:hypothetical protein
LWLIGQVKPTKTVHPNLVGLGPNHRFRHQTQIKHQGLGKSDLNYCALAVLIYGILWCYLKKRLLNLISFLGWKINGQKQTHTRTHTRTCRYEEKMYEDNPFDKTLNQSNWGLPNEFLIPIQLYQDSEH